jgi:hypothetical protein|tara:strand:- start:2303 stop:2443 length:141 start_codon:yes stop_codon:yes gene_type:complete
LAGQGVAKTPKRVVFFRVYEKRGVELRHREFNHIHRLGALLEVRQL